MMAELEEGAMAAGGGLGGLSREQRARAERKRQQARALRERLRREAQAQAQGAPLAKGGFVPERLPPPATSAAAATAAAVAPLHAHERPACEECGRRFAHSYLLATFDCRVCDDCRDEEGAHGLVTRTEAKSEFLLQDCDLDGRWGAPLRCERRRNPHRGGADMRLYLRAQVEACALAAWGGEEALAAERERREARRLQARQAKGQRRLRALRMDVRSSLFAAARADHQHRWGPERQRPDGDFEHTCLECQLTQTYEKM